MLSSGHWYAGDLSPSFTFALFLYNIPCELCSGHRQSSVYCVFYQRDWWYSIFISNYGSAWAQRPSPQNDITLAPVLLFCFLTLSSCFADQSLSLITFYGSIMNDVKTSSRPRVSEKWLRSGGRGGGDNAQKQCSKTHVLSYGLSAQITLATE